MAKKKAVRRSAPKRTKTPGSIALPELKKGEQYIGAILGADGKGHHIIQLPGETQGSSQHCMDWAKKAGGDLPDRVEQALQFRDHQAKFKRELYWSNTLCAGGVAYAWGQDFGYGGQDYWRKDDSYRGVAVRRVPLQ